MPLDPSIPLAVQPFKTESSANQLAMMESAAKLGEYQQNIARTNALRGLDRTDPNYINKVYQIDPGTGMKMEAHASTIKKETAQAGKAETENVAEHIKIRREALANVTTPEEFKAWSADNYKVPALRDYFNAQGMTSEKSQAQIDNTLKQPGGFQQLLGSAMIGSGELYKRNNMTASEKGNLNVAQGNLAVSQQTLANANNPVLQGNLAAARAGGTEYGKQGAIANIALPGAVATGEEAIRKVDALVGAAPVKNAEGKIISAGTKPHAGFQQSVGAGIPGLKYIPGTPAADFNARLNEIQGGAFLQAFNTLKGGGSITETEGTKATQAINRMSTAQSEKEFNTAAREYQDILRTGIGRAKAKAASAGGGGIPTGRAGAAPAAGGEIDFNSLK